jgi:hypothetical protein
MTSEYNRPFVLRCKLPVLWYLQTKKKDIAFTLDSNRCCIAHKGTNLYVKLKTVPGPQLLAIQEDVLVILELGRPWNDYMHCGMETCLWCCMVGVLSKNAINH